MNQHAKLRIGHSACPHDCPSTCALEVELLDGNRIGRVHGAKANTYTSGVVCAKVARYADRVHHPDRLLKPLIRAGAKGDGVWQEASWEAALDLVAEKFIAAEEKYGSETVWPYFYAASCIAAVTGSWQYEGGGAFHSNSGIFKLNQEVLEGTRMRDPSIRYLDHSRIGPVLTGASDALYGGPPVTAMLIQNTNPVNVAPEQRLVKQGFLRDDLFACVHEQFMTDTARLADVVLPATMFLEHDDVYKGGGNQHITLGPKLIEPPEGPRTNHFVIEQLAERLGVADRPGFGLTEQQHIDIILGKRGLGSFDSLKEQKWVDLQPDFETAHFIKGFGHSDGKFRFRADWTGQAAPNRPPKSMGLFGPVERLPEFPDHVDLIEVADDAHPFRLTTSPARNFLNSTFAETPVSKEKEGRPALLLHPDDAADLGLADGDRVEVGNQRGDLVLHAKFFDGIKRGVVIAEGIWPNSAHERGEGINVLTGADAPAPYGGAAFHDNKVWLRKAG